MTSEMGSGDERERGGSRYVGAPSRRWPEGRPLCGAKKRREEGYCTWAAGQGTDHLGRGPCERHGGNLPSHVIAAERAEIAATAARYSVPRHIHPLEGLLEQYAFRMGEVAHLRARVNALPPEALFWGVESETDRRSPEGDDGERLRTGAAAEFERKSKAGPAAVLEQYDRAQAAAEKLGLDIVRVGLEAARDSLASGFASRMQVELDALVVECAALAGERPGEDLTSLFRERMVARMASLAGVRVPIEGSVAA